MSSTDKERIVPIGENQPDVLELIEIGQEIVSESTKRQWAGEPAFRLSIPARHDRDTDLVLIHILSAAAQTIRNLRAVTAPRGGEGAE